MENFANCFPAEIFTDTFVESFMKVSLSQKIALSYAFSSGFKHIFAVNT